MQSVSALQPAKYQRLHLAATSQGFIGRVPCQAVAAILQVVPQVDPKKTLKVEGIQTCKTHRNHTPRCETAAQGHSAALSHVPSLFGNAPGKNSHGMRTCLYVLVRPYVPSSRQEFPSVSQIRMVALVL